ncbi:MAG: murein biosynthesis integral membrane protein MurJ [Thermodesulfobacteriota bacterium]
MNEKRQVARATGVIGGATLASRIFGYIRDMVVAGFLGAGLVADAFFIAFTIPNLLRRLFAEGALTISFIPVFIDRMKNQGREDAFVMARSALRLLTTVMLAVVLAGILFTPAIVRVIGWGWAADEPDKIALTVTLTRIMFPYLLFVSLVALCMGILNALGYFAAPAISPVFSNIAMIAAVSGAAALSGDSLFRAKGLAWGVVAGGVLQLALQLPFLMKVGLRIRQRAPLFHPGLKRVAILMLPAVFGAAVYQVNIVVGRLLATMLPEGSVSCLYYADRLVQFPLGVFALSGAMAALPSLSRQAAAGDYGAVADTFAFSLKLTFFITLPAMTGLIVLREPIVALLFQRGEFDAAAVRMTAQALLFYSLGLWAVSAARIVVSVFYALSDTRTPVLMAFVASLANIGFGLALMGPLAHGGLALAVSLSAVVNFILLMGALRARLPSLKMSAVTVSFVRSAVCSGLMGLVVREASVRLIPAGAGVAGLLAGIPACIVAGVACYVFFAYIAGSGEVIGLMNFFRRGNGPDKNRS